MENKKQRGYRRPVSAAGRKSVSGSTTGGRYHRLPDLFNPSV